MLTRDELENRINDAADGLLSETELASLQQQLQRYPDLLQDYREIMALPDLSGIYGTAEEYREPSRIRTIREMLIEEEPFSAASLFWFRKVALAASLLILAGSSLAGLFSGAFTDLAYTDMMTADVLIYPKEPGFAEEYVTYITEWPGNGVESGFDGESNRTGAQ